MADLLCAGRQMEQGALELLDGLRRLARQVLPAQQQLPQACARQHAWSARGCDARPLLTRQSARGALTCP